LKLYLVVNIQPGSLVWLLQFVLFEDELKLVSETADGGMVAELIG
jgi:hypothetical protein